jgi:hypothetical protein
MQTLNSSVRMAVPGSLHAFSTRAILWLQADRIPDKMAKM